MGYKTREQLLNELTEIRQRVAGLEESQLRRDRTEETSLAPGGLYDTTDRSMADAVIGRTQAEQRIIESEQLLQGILTASPFGIGKVKNRDIVWVNETLCRQSCRGEVSLFFTRMMKSTKGSAGFCMKREELKREW
ncbi:MAG: hypothetical protein ABSD38_39140 [Syntrophorhabdales bacterium]